MTSPLYRRASAGGTSARDGLRRALPLDRRWASAPRPSTRTGATISCPGWESSARAAGSSVGRV